MVGGELKETRKGDSWLQVGSSGRSLAQGKVDHSERRRMAQVSVRRVT